MSPDTTSAQPPVARKEPVVTTHFGQERVDNYEWLRNKTSQDVISYLEAENAYTSAVMQPTEELQKTLYTEMLGRIQQADTTVPYKMGDWLYYQRTEDGKQYPIYCRKRASVPDAPEVVLLDLNQIAQNEQYVGLGAFEISGDGNTLVYGLDTTGYYDYTLYLIDLQSGAPLPEQIQHGASAVFASDSRTLYYVAEEDETKRPYRLMRHTLGTQVSADVLVYEEQDPMFEIIVARSRSGDYVFATSLSTNTTEVRYLRAADPNASPVLIAAREPGHEYYVDHGGDTFYIRTNNNAPNFRLVTASVADPGRDHWTELVAHRDDVVLDNVDAFAGHLVLREREDGIAGLRVLDLQTNTATEIELPESPHALTSQPNVDFAATTFRYSYESPATPPTVYEYDLASRASKLLKRTSVLGGYDPSLYEARHEHATAADGTRIPISIVRRKDTPLSGQSPMLLYAYGAYAWPIDDKFSSNLISLLDRGIVYAVAHVRGGGELGVRWHEQGRLLVKKNTFTDFLTCVEWLIENGYTAKDRLVIHGLSAGGLTIGAALCMRPELFKAVVAQAPFVDVTTTMLDPTLPGTIPDYGEWGNPQQQEFYEYISSYSPYDTIQARPYPPVLITSSYNDSQVLYWGPAKFVAKLRATATGQNPVLLSMNMGPGGHMGKSGRFDQLEDQAFLYAFVLTHI